MREYTVGIQVWPFPVYRKFRVTSHQVEGTKVALYDLFGGVTVVPGLDRKTLRIYPDYRSAWEHQQRIAQSPQRHDFEPVAPSFDVAISP